MLFGHLGLGLTKNRLPDRQQYLDSVLPSVCCDLDSTIADSYPGSGQTWSNLIASPADGAAQTDYDFYLGLGSGASTDDPTFTGTAGDPAAYFALDGGDYFTSVDYTGQTTFRGAHRTDRDGVWFALAFRTSSTLASYRVPFASGSWTQADAGFVPYFMLDGSVYLWIANGSAKTIKTIEPVGSLVVNTDYLFIVSWDGTSSTNNMRSWLNTTTKTTFSAALQTSTADSTEGFTAIGAVPDDSTAKGPLTAGSRIYSFACGNAFIDDADAANIFSHLEERHNRDYTP
ncbi:MAG: hypothetical protein CUN56_00480 [Phototrophicales bacterium]|nr:MAG: hypothetical protein CUN56_00480 [Phototrophicales bacterium]